MNEEKEGGKEGRMGSEEEGRKVKEQKRKKNRKMRGDTG